MSTAPARRGILGRWFQGLSVARRFVPELATHRVRLGVVGLLSMGLAALDLLKPWPIGLIFDYALRPKGAPVEDPYRVVVLGVAALLGITVLLALVAYVREIQLATIGHFVSRGLRFRIFAHLTGLSPSFHARHKSGDLLMRLMGDVPMVTTMLVDASVEIATRSLIVLGTVGVMVWLDPLLTLFAFGVVPPLFLVVRWISRRIRSAVREARRKEGTLADFLHEAIAATSTIQALGGSEHVVHRFAKSNRKAARAGLRATRLSARLAASVESLLGLSLAVVVLFGGFRVLQGDLTAGELLVFISYLRGILKPIRSTSKNAARVAKGTACGERILTILDARNPVASPAGARPAPAHPRELTFEDVWYAYGEEKPALRGFRASFRAGELSALVGRSGAGKSTATFLALRLMDPDRGRVVLDGVPLTELELGSVRASAAVCMQQTVLFGESLRENLLLARPEASEEELLDALEEAGAREFVAALPEGLETTLGANGVGLSGGQQGRLSLARTLLRRATVLIVDEPFAGLDREAAGLVAETLRRLARDRIVVVIAHDLEAIEAFDHVVFVDHGRTIAQGTHDQIAHEHPTYRRIVRTTRGAVVPTPESRPKAHPEARRPGLAGEVL